MDDEIHAAAKQMKKQSGDSFAAIVIFVVVILYASIQFAG